MHLAGMLLFDMNPLSQTGLDLYYPIECQPTMLYPPTIGGESTNPRNG